MTKAQEVINNYQNGKLTYIDKEGEHLVDLDKFIMLGDQEILVKLNRTEQILLKVANAAPEKLKWVNDMAMAKVVCKLCEKVDDLSAKLVMKDSEIERLNNEHEASCVTIETRGSISEDDAEALYDKIHNLEDTINNLHDEMKNREDIISKLTDNLDYVNNKKAEIETELTNIKNNFNEATVKIRNIDSNNTELQNTVNEQNNLILTLNTTINGLNDDILSLQASLEEKTKVNELLNAKIKKLDEMEKRVEIYDNTINDLLNKLKQYKLSGQPTQSQQHRMGDNAVVDFNIGG